ncbi:hypothetical protein K438DRAFT_1971872 [Mycena galopus ATCC 62051]|nr:hypothetical protein K438DRAFT_1971872 [Mycena galopus ATCC 62051]
MSPVPAKLYRLVAALSPRPLSRVATPGLVARAAQPCSPCPKLCLPHTVACAGPAVSLAPPKPCHPAQSRVALSPAPAQPCRPRLRTHVAMPKMVLPRPYSPMPAPA